MKRWRAAMCAPLNVGAVVTLFVVACARPAAGQTMSELLSFLLTNRSIPTDNFVQDEHAAAATRDTISGFLLAELGMLPSSSSAGGFTYRFDRALGTSVRASDSFGPFFVERSLTAGKFQASFGASYRTATYDNIDGRKLRDGTLVATASKLRGDSQPFDIETVSLRLRSDTVTLSGNWGVTDALDIGAAVPLVRLTLNGERIDTYRGLRFLQATASGSASGLGDLIVRTKYHVLRHRGSGVAVEGETRLPTGNKQNLLGAGKGTFTPRVVGSLEKDRLAAHGNLGQSFGGVSDDLDYGSAITFVITPRLTGVGEITGRRSGAVGRLVETSAPHPRLNGVDTIRLTATEESSNRVSAIVGFKWNVATRWLLSGNVLRPMTRAGLNPGWAATLAFDLSFAH